MSTAILDYLDEHGGRLTDGHYVFTTGMHSTEYFNIRAVAQNAVWMYAIGGRLATAIREFEPEILIGPETLGRTFSTYTAPWLSDVQVIWCDIKGKGKKRKAVFNPKLDFGRLLQGRRVAVIDDLVTSGSSLDLTSKLVEKSGGSVVVGAAVVSRNELVGAVECGVPVLKVLENIKGARAYTPEECKEFGPCLKRVPVSARPGHGHEFILENPDYPVAS
jgi:orotate phosphoribosyltransferase